MDRAHQIKRSAEVEDEECYTPGGRLGVGNLGAQLLQFWRSWSSITLLRGRLQSSINVRRSRRIILGVRKITN